MIHRQDTVSLFGVPVSSLIDIEDSEAVLRAIRLTPADQPIDFVLRDDIADAVHDHVLSTGKERRSRRTFGIAAMSKGLELAERVGFVRLRASRYGAISSRYGTIAP
jgi:hypothetical protein